MAFFSTLDQLTEQFTMPFCSCISRPEHMSLEPIWFRPDDEAQELPEAPEVPRCRLSSCVSDRDSLPILPIAMSSAEFFDVSTPRRKSLPHPRQTEVDVDNVTEEHDLREQIAKNGAKVVNLESELRESRRRAAIAEQERDVYLKLLAGLSVEGCLEKFRENPEHVQ